MGSLAISARDLARARRDLEQLLTGTCTVLRPESFDDNAGGARLVPVEIATLPCKLIPSAIPGWEKTAAGELASYSVWQVRLPAGSDVRPQDTLAIGARVFEVQRAGEGTDAFQQVLQVVEILPTESRVP